MCGLNLCWPLFLFLVFLFSVVIWAVLLLLVCLIYFRSPVVCFVVCLELFELLPFFDFRSLCILT